MNAETHIDLGCGKNPRNPFSAQNVIGIDINDWPDFDKVKIESGGVQVFEGKYRKPASVR
jgi:hypothetical protein